MSNVVFRRYYRVGGLIVLLIDPFFFLERIFFFLDFWILFEYLRRKGFLFIYPETYGAVAVYIEGFEHIVGVDARVWKKKK